MNERLRMLIWGTGNYYKNYIRRFDECSIVALIDNDKEKQGKIIDSHLVISPQNIDAYEYDYIVILVEKYDEISIQLQQLNIEWNKIIFPVSDGLFNNYRKVIKHSKKKKSDILLISHEMSMTGAPLMLFEMAKILKKNGKLVDVASRGYGRLGQYYTQEGISVFEFDDFMLTDEEVVNYFSEYDIIVVNTLDLCALVEKLQHLNVEIVWWLHEEKGAYSRIRPNRNMRFESNLHVFGVGNRAIGAFTSFFANSNVTINNLQWGIPLKSNTKRIQHEKIIIAVIGYVNHIKGQDILIDAVKKDNYGIYSQIELWLIGEMSENNRKLFGQYEFIKIFGVVDHAELLNMYGEIDIVLSTSRNDTMPVVLVEGLMNKRVCLTSDGTGVSDYIEQYKNGVVFESENVDDLNEKINWLLDNRALWGDIGKKGFQLYCDRFSMEQFEADIINIIGQCYK